MCGWLPPCHEGAADCRPDRDLFAISLFKSHIHFARSRILLWTCSSKGETALGRGSASQISMSCCMCEPMDTPSPSTMTHMLVAPSGHWTTRRWSGPMCRAAARLCHRCVLETWTRADVNVRQRPLRTNSRLLDDIGTKSSDIDSPVREFTRTKKHCKKTYNKSAHSIRSAGSRRKFSTAWEIWSTSRFARSLQTYTAPIV